MPQAAQKLKLSGPASVKALNKCKKSKDVWHHNLEVKAKNGGPCDGDKCVGSFQLKGTQTIAELYEPDGKTVIYVGALKQ